MIHTKKRSKNRKKKQHRRNLKKTKRPLGTIAKRFLSITLGNFLFCNRYLLASHICAKQLTWKGFTCRWLLLAYLISNLVPFSPPSYQKIYLKYHPLHPKKHLKPCFMRILFVLWWNLTWKVESMFGNQEVTLCYLMGKWVTLGNYSLSIVFLFDSITEMCESTYKRKVKMSRLICQTVRLVSRHREIFVLGFSKMKY